MANDSDFKLCYIDGDWAFFTTASLDDQWGDDWNDAPYEHNAGCPYGWAPYRKCPPYEIKQIAFISDLERPCSRVANSWYSVQQINAGEIPWLRTPTWYESEKPIVIPAGTTLPEFIRLIQEADGEIYVKLE